MKQFNNYKYYFTESPKKTPLPGGDENVKEQVTHKNNDETGAVKEKTTLVESDKSKGK